MGIKERNRIKNQQKAKDRWLERQREIQAVRKKSPYDIYESERIWKHALENGFD